ncbi:hypothetical protein [Cupriavidus sp. IK-TO18]|uniref:hypothetical protein n=1 Tax=Cupriavidus sp. IK-TO18 TaxID=2782182 RepID=UPI00189B980F|nr:hypothetical protein [Cupriavidus sp. IK-TO18]MBF6990938.1 hypothetical protein [Cupriavidus sp. IK-TO18]
MKKLIAVAFAAVSLSATAGPMTDAMFESASNRLFEENKAGKITALALAQGQERLVKEFYPNDYKLQQLFEYKTEIAGQYQRGEISSERYQALIAARADAVFPTGPAQGQPVFSQPEQQPGPSISGRDVANFFGALGGSMTRANQAPQQRQSATCLSHVQGGTLVTSCN